jgi:hypothetical protein
MFGRQNRDLAANRRGVIIVTNIEEIRSERQDADLQMDQGMQPRRTGKSATTEQAPAKKKSQSNKRESQQGSGQ